MKENVIKRFLTIILCILFCFTLFACSKEEPISLNFADSKFVGEYGVYDNDNKQFTNYPCWLQIYADGTGVYNFHALSNDEEDFIFRFSWYPEEDGDGIRLAGEITYYESNLPKETRQSKAVCHLYENDTIISILGDRLGRIK